jgi:hypothetical protein
VRSSTMPSSSLWGGCLYCSQEIAVVTRHQEFLARTLDPRNPGNRPIPAISRNRGEHLGVPRHGNFLGKF